VWLSALFAPGGTSAGAAIPPPGLVVTGLPSSSPCHALGRAAAFAGAGAQELRSLGVGEAVPEATVRLEIRAVAQALSQPRLRLVRARARARARANAGLRIS
jgi:hypothetical protein